MPAPEIATATFLDCADDYLAEMARERKLRPIDIQYVEKLKRSSLAPLMLSEIKTADIHRAVNEILPGAKASTKNRNGVSVAAAICHHGARKGLCDWLRVGHFKDPARAGSEDNDVDPWNAKIQRRGSWWFTNYTFPGKSRVRRALHTQDRAVAARMVKEEWERLEQAAAEQAATQETAADASRLRQSLPRSVGRPDVMELKFTTPLAGLFEVLGTVIKSTAAAVAFETTSSLPGTANWLSDPIAFDQATKAIAAAMERLRPKADLGSALNALSREQRRAIEGLGERFAAEVLEALATRPSAELSGDLRAVKDRLVKLGLELKLEAKRKRHSSCGSVSQFQRTNI